MFAPGLLLPEERNDLAALWRMVELCLPTHEECGAVTFVPRGGETFEADWHDWVADTHVPVLAPALLSLQRLAAAASLTALLEEDAVLGSVLPPAAAQRSLTVGRQALLDVRPPQGVKLFDRLREATAGNEAAVHMVTVFAVRAHAFHLPCVQAAASLLLAECVLGASSVGITLSARRAVDLLGVAKHCCPAAPLLAAV